MLAYIWEQLRIIGADALGRRRHREGHFSKTCVGTDQTRWVSLRHRARTAMDMARVLCGLERRYPATAPYGRFLEPVWRAFAIALSRRTTSARCHWSFRAAATAVAFIPGSRKSTWQTFASSAAGYWKRRSTGYFAIIFCSVRIGNCAAGG